MTEEERIAKSLSELKRLTGLSLTLAPSETADEEAAERLAMLTSAFKERYDRTNFIRNLLYGKVEEADLYAAASKFHIPENARRVVYVIECEDNNAENAGQILKHLFLRESGDLQAVLDERRAVLIRSLKAKETADEQLTLAHTIVDMLNAEAMIKVRVGYGNEIESLKFMPEAFHQAVLSLEVSRVFYSGENVVSYSRLGIGRLIHDLPEDTCRLFLSELFGDGSPDDFDEDTRSIINAFFENNLNISETARQLYLHRNTLVYRLEKLRQMTGLDLRLFDDAAALKLAMMISESLKDREREEKHGI